MVKETVREEKQEMIYLEKKMGLLAVRKECFVLKQIQ